MKLTIEYMGGDRVDGYYYIKLKGTDFILCKGGHPDFPYTFREKKKPERR